MVLGMGVAAIPSSSLGTGVLGTSEASTVVGIIVASTGESVGSSVGLFTGLGVGFLLFSGQSSIGLDATGASVLTVASGEGGELGLETGVE
jgi:hypothetical protein